MSLTEEEKAKIKEEEKYRAEARKDAEKKPLHKQNIGCGGFLLIIIISVIVIVAIFSSGGEKKETTSEQQLSQEQSQFQEEVERKEERIEQLLSQEQTKPQEEVKKEEQQQELQKETTELSDEDQILVIEATLGIYGIYNVNMQIADGRPSGGAKVLILSYKSSASTSMELAIEAGIIVGSYTSAVKNGWDIDELSVVVGDIQGNAVGMWYCSEEWTDEYVMGEITMEELGVKILTTMTTF